VEDERRQGDQHKDAMEKANTRMKGYKRQLEQSHDDISTANSTKRKLQRDLDEQVEMNESLTRENNTLKQRQRRGLGGSSMGNYRKGSRNNPDPEELSDED